MIRPEPPVLPAPPYGRRVAAFAIDLVLAGAAVLAVAAAAGEASGSPTATVLAAALAGLLVPLAWSRATARRGGSAGKRLLRLRVRAVGGGPVRFGAARRREYGRLAILAGCALGGALAASPFATDADSTGDVAGTLLVGALLGAPAALLGYVWPLRDARGQSWHDKLGATTVVPRDAEPIPTADWAPPRMPREDADTLGLVYPSWWERLGAWLIDQALVITVLTTVISIPAAAGAFEVEDGELSTTAATILIVAVTLSLTLGTALYGAVLIGWREQTLGKHALGLVVRRDDGSRVGYRRALPRELVGRGLAEGVAAFAAGGQPTNVSGLAALTNRQRQTWHDRIGGTVVVRGTPELRPFRRRRPATPDPLAQVPEPPAAAPPPPAAPEPVPPPAGAPAA